MREKKTSFKAHAAGLVGVILLILGVLCLPVATLAAESIKFATLAPKGSTWMNNFDAMARELRSKTDGDLRIRSLPERGTRR